MQPMFLETDQQKCHTQVLLVSKTMRVNFYSVYNFQLVSFINTDRVNNILFVKVNFTSADIYCGLHIYTNDTSCNIRTIYGPEKDCHHHYPPSDKNRINGANISDMFTTDKVDISYLPQNEAFCFVAVALSANSAEYVILKGGFTTKSG